MLSVFACVAVFYYPLTTIRSDGSCSGQHEQRAGEVDPNATTQRPEQERNDNIICIDVSVIKWNGKGKLFFLIAGTCDLRIHGGYCLLTPFSSKRELWQVAAVCLNWRHPDCSSSAATLPSARQS